MLFCGTSSVVGEILTDNYFPHFHGNLSWKETIYYVKYDLLALKKGKIHEKCPSVIFSATTTSSMHCKVWTGETIFRNHYVQLLRVLTHRLVVLVVFQNVISMQQRYFYEANFFLCNHLSLVRLFCIFIPHKTTSR